jgi:mannose-6-phosphate isomerase-like protein (cupin superfamily)
LDSKDHPAINDWHVKLGKEKGEFARHNRKKEDELFFVVRGRLTIKTRDRDVDLREGEFLIIPRGVEHKPVAGEEAYLVLLESRPP